MIAGEGVYVITPVWATEAEVPPAQPDDGYWQTLLVEDDPDPEFRTYCHLFAARRSWRYGCLDVLLRDIADDNVAGILITDTQMRRIYHPYAWGTGSIARSACRLAFQPPFGSLTGQPHHRPP